MSAAPSSLPSSPHAGPPLRTGEALPAGQEAFRLDDLLPVPSFAGEIAGQDHVPVVAHTVPRRRSWKKRRFQFALLAVLILSATVVMALASGRRSRIIFINAGDDPLPALTVTAAGQTHSVPPLDARASYRWVMPDGGGAEPVHLRSAIQGQGTIWNWQGNPLGPDDGTSLILRLWPDGSVEESTESSIWSDLFGN